FQRDAMKLQKESAVMLESVRAEVASIGARKKEFETFDQRMRALHLTGDEAETRMQAIGAKDQHITTPSQKLDRLSKRFALLFSQADDLTRKQLTLETLHEKLAEVDGLAKRASWQADALRQSRADLDVLRKEIQQFYASHADIAKLSDKLGADRQALEAVGERITGFQSKAPELEAKMDAILG